MKSPLNSLENASDMYASVPCPSCGDQRLTECCDDCGKLLNINIFNDLGIADHSQEGGCPVENVYVCDSCGDKFDIDDIFLKCVKCNGTAHYLNYAGFSDGGSTDVSITSYKCIDCGHKWDDA